MQYAWSAFFFVLVVWCVGVSIVSILHGHVHFVLNLVLFSPVLFEKNLLFFLLFSSFLFISFCRNNTGVNNIKNNLLLKQLSLYT